MSCVILGAGVIGLSSALLLCENGYKVKVIAKHFPHDSDPSYTSPWAGAHFRPFPSQTLQDQMMVQLTRITQRHFRHLSKTDPHSSIRFIQGIEYFELPSKSYLDLGSGYCDEIDNFHIIDDLPKGCRFGTSYTTWILDPSQYLNYLYCKLKNGYDVEFVRQEVDSLYQLECEFPNTIIVNCSGRGVAYHGGYDPQVYSIRGQTLLIRVDPQSAYLHKTITHQLQDGLWTFIIPRSHNSLILGGTKQIDVIATVPRNEDTEAIINRGKYLFPELFVNRDVDIQKINVGFRPARHGGIRLEVEQINGLTIIHAYGAGGMGYELSYGMANKVLELLGKTN